MSTLTSAIKNLFNGFSGTSNAMMKGSMIDTYHLNSSQKINTIKARNIYNNIDNDYKLSAGMIRPIINADVSFIGEPTFLSNDDRTSEALKEINKQYKGYFQAIHKIALREGDVYVWPQWSDEDKTIKWKCIPVDKLQEIIYDPITDNIIQYNFKWNIDYKDTQLVNKQMTVNVIIDKDTISYQYTGSYPSKYTNEVVKNVLGVIPVVQFSNEKELFDTKGHSEITAIEPYLKAYHDVMLMALQSQKNNSAPKLKIKTSNFSSFIDANFGAGTFSRIQNGDQKEGVNVKNLDLCLFDIP